MNRCAIALWVGAICLIAAQCVITYVTLNAEWGLAHDAIPTPSPLRSALLISSVFSPLIQGLIIAGSMVGLGALVELVDQIRWNALHRGA